MEQYKNFRPTALDHNIYLDNRENWFVVPVSRTRDTGSFSESNFETALKMLGGESDSVEVHRFGHWGPGWFEIIIIDNEKEDIVSIGEDIENSLADYPILDEGDLSMKEVEEQEESWSNWAESDFQSGIESKFDIEIWDYQLNADKFDVRQLFETVRERENIYWEAESDESQYIDIDRIVEAVTEEDLAEFMDEFEKHYVNPNQIVMEF